MQTSIFLRLLTEHSLMTVAKLQHLLLPHVPCVVLAVFFASTSRKLHPLVAWCCSPGSSERTHEAWS